MSKRVAVALTLTVLAGFGAVLLATLDVHVEAGRSDGGPLSCSAAYDVALLERDCYVGGELATDHGGLDRAGVAKAWTYLALAGVAGIGALGAGAYAVGVLTSRVREGGAVAREGAARA